MQEGCVKWIKGDSKYLYCEKSFLFGINAVLFNFVFIKEKSSHVPKTMKQHNRFNTHNKSAYQNDF